MTKKRFPCDWAAAEMLKIHIRNARKYKKSKANGTAKARADKRANAAAARRRELGGDEDEEDDEDEEVPEA